MGHAGQGKFFGMITDDPKVRAEYLRCYELGWRLRHGRLGRF
jgi:hypothetical protein